MAVTIIKHCGLDTLNRVGSLPPCSVDFAFRYMFAAVAAHKFVIAFCIGVELIASKTRTYLSVIYVCTFAVVSPLGIGIGMCLVGGGSAAASGILPVLLQVDNAIYIEFLVITRRF